MDDIQKQNLKTHIECIERDLATMKKAAETDNIGSIQVGVKIIRDHLEYIEEIVPVGEKLSA